jgi:hypothetical protein
MLSTQQAKKLIIISKVIKATLLESLLYNLKNKNINS